jgi:purine-binding chemotaxis protein CheW
MTETQNETFSEERFLVFLLGESRFAMPLLSAKEVMAPRKTISIPSSNKIIKGIINLRGTIITVIDLKCKLGLVSKKESDEASFIILDDANFSYGIIVDAVETVLSIKSNQIEKMDATMDKTKSTHSTRLAKVEDKLILILDIEDLISDLSHKQTQQKHAV